MHHYLSGIQQDALALGTDAGSGLTTGVRNVLLGSGAGRNLTTGSGNVILGAAGAETATAVDTIVLSTGTTRGTCTV